MIPSQENLAKQAIVRVFNTIMTVSYTHLRVLVETRGTTGKETTSYWFDLPIDVAEFEEKLGVGAESQDYRIIEKAPVSYTHLTYLQEHG